MATPAGPVILELARFYTKFYKRLLKSRKQLNSTYRHLRGPIYTKTALIAPYTAL
jgi:hypothetical protein